MRMRLPTLLAAGLAAATLAGCVYAPPAPHPHRGPPAYHPAPPGGPHGDRDRDGVPNRYDRDRDDDGVPNRFDRKPNNPRRY